MAIYDRQVSWLTVFGQSCLPAFAVTFFHALLMIDHSDEFVQDFHLFPFSPANNSAGTSQKLVCWNYII